MSILGIIASSRLAAAGDFESIATVTVGSGGAASATFSSIPGTYTHLQIRASARTNRGDFQDVVGIKYNSDTGTNYNWHYIVGDGASASANAGTTTATNWGALVGGNSVNASTFGGFVLDILDYANTNKYKTHRTLSGVDNNDTNGRILLMSGAWRNTNAITSIELYPAFGSLFNQYSSFALYGIKAA